MRLAIFLDGEQQGFVEEFTLGAQRGESFVKALIVKKDFNQQVPMFFHAIVGNVTTVDGQIQFHCYSPNRIKRKSF